MYLLGAMLMLMLIPNGLTARNAGLDWAVVRPKSQRCRQGKGLLGDRGGWMFRRRESRCLLQVMTIKGDQAEPLCLGQRGQHFDAQVMV